MYIKCVLVNSGNCHFIMSQFKKKSQLHTHHKRFQDICSTWPLVRMKGNHLLNDWLGPGMLKEITFHKGWWTGFVDLCLAFLQLLY